MKTKSPMRFLSKALPAFAAGIFVAVVLVVQQFYTIQDSAEKNGQSQLVQTTNYVSKTLLLGIDNRKQILNELALQMELTSMKEVAPIRLTDSSIQQAFNNLKNECNYIFLTNTNGQVLEVKEWKNGQLITVGADKVTSYILSDKSFKEILDEQPYNQNGREYFWEDTSYLNLYQKVTDAHGNFQGFLVAPLNLVQFYNHEIQVKNNPHKGYSMIKNKEMVVVMHPAREQIGMDIITDRKRNFPGLDLTDLEQLEIQQLSEKQGVAKYYSYWWNEESLPSVLKLQAFQWIDIGKTSWVVTVNSDFYELNRSPLNNALITIILLVLVLIATIYFIVEIHRREKLELVERSKQQLAQYELEKKLYQENKLETIGLLTTTIVHDMNNFLTPIVGNAELLIEENQENKQLQEDLQEILIAAQKGKKLASNVLRFSRTNSYKQIEEQDLSKSVYYAIDTIKGMIPKKIGVDIKVSSDIGTANFEEQDLQILIYNLITNAYQAINQNDENGKITIFLKEDTPETVGKFWNPPYVKRKGKYALLIIEDNGPGISQEMLETVFEPFVTTKNKEGTGLGLFVVSSIVQKYDWGLHVDSTPGSGTKFTIVIPINTKSKLS